MRARIIRFVSGAPLEGATLPWQIDPPHESRTIIVKATADLVQGQKARFRDIPDGLCGDLHADDRPEGEVVYPSDFALFKPRADVTLRACAATTGSVVSQSTVQFTIGRGRKRLHRVAAIFGDRTWSGHAVHPSAAAHFRKMPLIAGRAFGGDGFAPNPLGRGVAPQEGVHLLPNVEDPRALMKGPRDTPAPVLFGPVPARFASRSNKLGTYDDRWLRARWPYFPEDFDWSYFQSAPREQQLDSLLGDEPYEFLGMSTEHAAVHGTLPCLRVRCFARTVQSAGRRFFEVNLRLDTAHFDLEASTAHLVWRGVLAVRDDEASEIDEMFLLAEPIEAAPATLETAYAAYLGELARMAKRGGPAPRADEPPTSEAPGTQPLPESFVAPAPPPAPPADFANLPPDILAKLALMGIDPRSVANYVPPPKPPPREPPGTETFVDSLRRGGASDEDIAAMRASRSQEPGSPRPGAQARGEPAAIPDAPDVDPHPGPAESGSLDGLDLDDRDLSGMDLSKRSLRGARLRRAKLVGTNLAGACLDEASLADADLTDADLTGSTLERADLTGATLAGARLSEAKLTDTDFTRARAPRASFERATGARPLFYDADLSGATFESAALADLDLTGALLDGAVFEHAELPNVRLFDAKGNNVRFAHAKIPGARADSVALPGAAFGSVVAPRSIWDGAVLDGATFFGADLQAAGFTRASCHRTTFSSADLREARFAKAMLVDATLLGANLMRATLEGANLSSADARGANLHGAELWKAVVDGAHFDGAIMTATKLERRS